MLEYFYWGVKVDHLLFKGFASHSVGGLIGQCLFVGSMAFLFEFLRYIQTKQKQKELILRVKQLKLICTTECSALITQSVANPQNPLNITLFDRALLFGMEISLWLLLQNIGYFIMLAVMVYNAWFLVSAVIGGALGYFVFGQMFMKLNLQNCHIMRSAYCGQICGEPSDTLNQIEGESTPAAKTPSSSHNSLECAHNSNAPEPEAVQVRAQCH
ncbi:probable low affinity copper uptake protein 2 isoform X2 [Diabrotica virgifera virgifera]|uniref:Copper transport protein n=1 Tax=Diabrotica virgifera virgifera TaxID=50390 RepID=A0A6P7G9D0_DIAVI|nr:probable low affinity copper uptake protein 2 isoform X2 [Diabrotica virgifera virgifera]